MEWQTRLVYSCEVSDWTHRDKYHNKRGFQDRYLSIWLIWKAEHFGQDTDHLLLAKYFRCKFKYQRCTCIYMFDGRTSVGANISHGNSFSGNVVILRYNIVLTRLNWCFDFDCARNINKKKEIIDKRGNKHDMYIY